MHDIGPSGGTATTSGKGEVATHGDESDDVEILETPEERRSISEPPADEPAIEKALVETGVSIEVTPPEIVPAATEATVLGVSYTEAARYDDQQ